MLKNCAAGDISGESPCGWLTEAGFRLAVVLLLLAGCRRLKGRLEIGLIIMPRPLATDSPSYVNENTD
jgi:hypothetical protein